MIKIENITTYGWEAAIRGMRNPLNSWEKSDSYYCDADHCAQCVHDGDEQECNKKDGYYLGPNDLDLAMRLAKAGTEHRKFMRMINVTMDITAPLYWWKEKVTYKVGTVANSCSTMHTIHKKPFELDDFSHDHIINMDTIEDELRKESMDSHGFFDYILGHSEEVPTIMLNDSHVLSPEGGLEVIIKLLNKCRDLYLKTKDKKYWWQMIQLLPSSYNQKRTVQMNYEVLAGIYRQRKNHKLDEWHTFCHMIEKLPYSQLMILNESDIQTTVERSMQDLCELWMRKKEDMDANKEVDSDRVFRAAANIRKYRKVIVKALHENGMPNVEIAECLYITPAHVRDILKEEE